MIQHNAPISHIDTYGGKFILTAGYDNKIILWDSHNQLPLAVGHHDHLVNQCTFNSSGTLAASSSSDYSVRIWQLPELQLKCVLLGHEDDVEGIAFHPQKPLIATCSRDKTICLFELSGQLLCRMNGHEADIISIQWLPDSDMLVSSSDDGTVKYWDMQQQKLMQSVDLDNTEIDTVAMGDNGILYVGNDEGEIVLLSEHGYHTVKAHQAGIKHLSYHSDSRILVSSSYDRCCKVWSCYQNELHFMGQVELPDVIWPRCFTFLNNERLVFGTFGSRYATYDLAEKCWFTNEIKETPGTNAVIKYQDTIYNVGDSGIFYVDSKAKTHLKTCCNFIRAYAGQIITGGQNGKVYNALTGVCYYQHHSPLNCADVFMYAGRKHLAVGTYTGEVLIFRENLQTVIDRNAPALVLVSSIKMHKNAIKGIACSDECIFTVCADAAMAVYETRSLKRCYYKPEAHQKIANACAWLRGNEFLSVSRDLKLRRWHMQRNIDNTCLMSVETIDTPSLNSIKCVAADLQGELIAIGNYTGYIGIYQLATQTWLHWRRISASGISSLSAGPAGEWLCSTFAGASYQLAQVEKGRVLQITKLGGEDEA